MKRKEKRMKIAVPGTGMVGNAIGTKLVQSRNHVSMGSRTGTNRPPQENESNGPENRR